MKTSTDGQKTSARVGERRLLSLVPQFLALVLVLSTIGVLPIYSVAAASASTTTTTCTPDFSMTVAPATLTIVKGGPLGRIGVGFKSLCGLAGTINFGVRGVTPRATETCNSKGVCTSNGLLFHQCCYDLPIGANGGTGNTITVNATKNTLATTYQVRITGTDVQGGPGHGVTHSANVTITVSTCCVASFTSAANPTSITVKRGQTATSAITATGTGGFNAQIFYSGVISPSSASSESCNLQPPQPTLTPSAPSVISLLTCSFPTAGTYTVTETVAPSGGTPTRTVVVTIIVT
ncbi:MAG: hypothetical protein OK455_02075 [Thaumarchaeota archaeon]|nr:hypothetical protein [Nitrososphaerota archaeon]